MLSLEDATIFVYICDILDWLVFVPDSIIEEGGLRIGQTVSGDGPQQDESD